MKTIFNQNDTNELLARVNQLTPTTTPAWGKMDVAQMMAHCNVPYKISFESGQGKKLGFFKNILFKYIIKPIVVGKKPYKKNNQTAPELLMTTEKNFDSEKAILVDNIKKTYNLGESYFENKKHDYYGVLSLEEWNRLFYKHLEHHLTQFGV